MYEGYLALGGGEVLNSARSVGYTTTVDCPVNWLVCPPCDGIVDALGHNPYHYDNISEAPWYDEQDEPTHRFLGAHGISFEGIPDSTREAEVAEGILDGGVVGRVRNATRRIRVRAMLTALGEDALEVGFSWLNSALTPGRCGLHGDACGAADARFYAACPPTQAEITTPVPIWNDPLTNLVTNPAFETGAPTFVTATNLAPNPSFETPSATPVTLSTNYVLNPSMEAPGTAVVVETNLAPNPSFEAFGGVEVEVRRNLYSNPGAGHPWSNVKATETDLSDGTQFDVTSEIGVGDWVILSGQNVGGLIGEPFIAEIEVEVPTGFPAISLFYQMEMSSGHLNGDPVTINPGEKKRVGLNPGMVWGDTSAHRLALRIGTFIMPLGARFIVRKMMAEYASIRRPYFDGSTAAGGDWTYLWTGAVGASQSVQYGLPVAGVQSIGGAGVVSSQEWSSNRARSLRVISNGHGDNDLARISISGLKANTAYTARATARLTVAQLPGGNTRNRSLWVSPAGGTAVSVAAPNEPGVHPLAVAFTTGPTETTANVDLIVGGGTAGEEMWWDDLMIVEGKYIGPYFDGASAGETRRNLFFNPRGTALTRWGSSAPSVALSLITNFPGDVNTAVRAASTTTSTVRTHEMKVTLGASKPYRIRMSVRASVALTGISVQARPDTGSAAAFSVFGVVDIPAGESEIDLTGTTGFFGHGSAAGFTLVGVLPPGATLDVTKVLVTKGGDTGPYFDGETPIGSLLAEWAGAENDSESYLYDPDFTYAWTGDPDASTSTKNGVGVKTRRGGNEQTLVVQSTVRPNTHRSVAARIVSINDVGDNNAIFYPDSDSQVKDLPNGTYTYSMDVWVPSGTPKVTLVADGAGTQAAVSRVSTLYDQWERLVVPFSVDATGNSTLRLRADTAAPIGSEWWVDSEMVTAGNNADYFDGTTASPNLAVTVGWSGTPDNSTSVATADGVADVPAPPADQSIGVQVPDGMHRSFALRYIIATAPAVGLAVTSFLPTTGTTYTMIAMVRPRTRDQVLAPRIRGAVGPASLAPKDVWTEYRLTIAAGSGAVQQTGFLIASGSGHQPGDLIDIDQVLIVEGGYNDGYFDGTTPAAGDFTYAWSGAADASESRQIAPGVADWPTNKVVQSSEWAASRAKSARKIAHSPDSDGQVVGVAGDLLTLVATGRIVTPGAIAPRIGFRHNGHESGTPADSSVALPLTAGVHTVRLTTTVPAGTTSNKLRMWSSDTEVWWDSLLVVKGAYEGPYFDGEFPDSPSTDYEIPGTLLREFDWTGTPDASTSTFRTGNVTSVEDPIAYEEKLLRMVRNLHTVTCVAGPTVIQKYHRGDTWGYQVEFVLVAAVPWMYGDTRPVELAPSIPIVIQDVPFNLVPYPSAELTEGTVIAATNYVKNPSVEANTTDWARGSDGSVIPSSAVVLERTTELEAHGSASVRAKFTATTSGSNGHFYVQTTVPLPDLNDATRFSANLWATASIESGTAVLGTLDHTIYWLNSSNSTLREDDINVGPAAGGAFSLKSIAPPPAGTTQAILRAIIRVTSFSSGAVIRLYADAATVSVP